VGHTDDARLEGHGRRHQAEGGRVGAVRPVAEASEPSGLADNRCEGWRQVGKDTERCGSGSGPQGLGERPVHGGSIHVGRPGSVNGHWSNADWLACRDGKWRPVEPGAFPLAHGSPGRVGRLRAYGNAIVPQVAAEFIGAWLDCQP
jgi:DNA (cytosine-5)-methyltransferase 1